MEIKRIGENKIRCALTETEIQAMGFDIDDIIGNGETTQRFMQDVLSMVQKQENIHLEHVSPMVKAELLQDHSMAITFGGEAEASFQGLVETMQQLMNKMGLDGIADFKSKSKEERKELIEGVLKNVHTEPQDAKLSDPQQTEKKSMKCALRFLDMEAVVGTAKVCFPEKLPKSSLYKMEGMYYLVMDFDGFVKSEMRPFAFGAVEYDDGHLSEPFEVAYIQEHGTCILEKNAIQMLIKL
ncbi:MAG: adaptor protein MecA [Roseburia sp.]